MVGEGAVLGARCQIHAGAFVGRDCRLGDDVVLHPHAVLYDDCTLGHRVIIHANAVIGADGFGYRTQNGRHVKVPQLGRVEIGDDVEIGACTTIDRGTFGPTRIGAGTKIDNLVMIAHNCQIGRHNLLVSQVGIAGSCTTGDYVVMAGQSGMADHFHRRPGGHRGPRRGREGRAGRRPDARRPGPAAEGSVAVHPLDRATPRIDPRRPPDQAGAGPRGRGMTGPAAHPGPRAVGLIACAGRFPIAFAEKAREVGIPVVCVGIAGMADPELTTVCHRFHWMRRLSLGFIIRAFRRGGVRRWTMAGKFHKHILFRPWRWFQLLPDWRMIRFWLTRRRTDKRDDALLLGLIDEFRAEGMECVSPWTCARSCSCVRAC